MLALFTIVQDETHFLTKWLEHHAHAFDPENIYILNHGTGDEAAEDTLSTAHSAMGFNVIRVNHQYSYDHFWLRDIVQNFQHFLMQSYDGVVYTSPDQLLLPKDPAVDLSTYLNKVAEEGTRACVYTQGYEVVHDDDGTEEEMQWDYPIGSQRKWWTPCEVYSRPAVSFIKLSYLTGLYDAHNTTRTDMAERDLLLLNLHKADIGSCLDRHRKIATRLWAEESRSRGFYRYNLIDDYEILAKWFKADMVDTTKFAQFQLIPDEVRSRF
jgi:hypothetical protein